MASLAWEMQSNAYIQIWDIVGFRIWYNSIISEKLVGDLLNVHFVCVFLMDREKNIWSTLRFELM